MIPGREILICHNCDNKKHEIYSTKRNNNFEGNDNKIWSANLRDYLLSYCARHVTIMSIISLESSFRNQLFRHLHEETRFGSIWLNTIRFLNFVSNYLVIIVINAILWLLLHKMISLLYLYICIASTIIKYLEKYWKSIKQKIKLEN